MKTELGEAIARRREAELALVAAHADHAAALAVARRAAAARASAAHAAHEAGLSYRVLARVMGISAPMVVDLVQAGAAAHEQKTFLSTTPLAAKAP